VVCLRKADSLRELQTENKNKGRSKGWLAWSFPGLKIETGGTHGLLIGRLEGKSYCKCKGKNNRGSLAYHPQAEENAWGPVHSG